MSKTNEVLTLGYYSQNTIRAYLTELRYFFVYYSDIDPFEFTEEMMIQYLLYLVKTLQCSRVKCRMAGQSIAFFFRHILKCPYTIPGFIYPRKTTKLPPVMSPEEVKALINSIQNVKHRTIVMMLYSTGMRLAEIAALKITDIDSKNMRIKVVQGKGAKDRFTLLSQQVLLELRAYYLIYRPQEFLFNGYTKGKAMSKRMIQHIVHNTLDRMGFASKNYSVHTIRHSFATHLIENGTDLHTIKELLGHTDLQTTSRYLHFTTTRISQVINPYDSLDKTDQQQ